MTRQIGDPIFAADSPDGAIFKVGVSDRSSDGKLTATGELTVTVPNPADYDEASLRSKARDLAAEMVSADPSLLTPEGGAGGGAHTVLKNAGDKTAWGDGESKHGSEKGAAKPSGILSPDSGQVNI